MRILALRRTLQIDKAKKKRKEIEEGAVKCKWTLKVIYSTSKASGPSHLVDMMLVDDVLMVVVLVDDLLRVVVLMDDLHSL